jgi:hypothetical protein
MMMMRVIAGTIAYITIVLIGIILFILGRLEERKKRKRENM